MPMGGRGGGGMLGALDSFVVTLNLFSTWLFFFCTRIKARAQWCVEHILLRLRGGGPGSWAGQQFMLRGGGVGGGIQYPHDGECSKSKTSTENGTGFTCRTFLPDSQCETTFSCLGTNCDVVRLNPPDKWSVCLAQATVRRHERWWLSAVWIRNVLRSQVHCHHT